MQELETPDGDPPTRHAVPKPETASAAPSTRYETVTDVSPEPDVVETSEDPFAQTTGQQQFLAGLNEGEETGRLTDQHPAPRELQTEEIEKSLADNESVVVADTKHHTADNILYAQYPELEYSNFFKKDRRWTKDELLYVAGVGRKKVEKASAAAKKQVEMVKLFSRAMESAGYIVKGFDDYSGDAETLNEMQAAFVRLAEDFPNEAKGVTIQLSHTEDPTDIGWCDVTTKTISYNRHLFKNWTSLQSEYTSLVKSGHFPVGTDARGCFYHEFGHAIWSARELGSLRKATDAALSRVGYGYLNVSQRKNAP